MRALVISDTHFGAWTGEDILREPENLALLGPHLYVDEVIMLVTGGQAPAWATFVTSKPWRW